MTDRKSPAGQGGALAASDEVETEGNGEAASQPLRSTHLVNRPLTERRLAACDDEIGSARYQSPAIHSRENIRSGNNAVSIFARVGTSCRLIRTAVDPS